jgi:hypothetical protein
MPLIRPANIANTFVSRSQGPEVPRTIVAADVPALDASKITTGVFPASQLPTTYPIWTKYTKTFADFSAASLTATAALLTLPIKGVVHATFINVTTAFTGGLVASLTLSVGTGGSPLKYSTAINAFVSGQQVPQPLMGVESLSGTTAIIVTATGTVGLLNTLTQGSADFWILQSTLP